MNREEAETRTAALNAYACPECGVTGGSIHMGSCRWLAKLNYCNGGGASIQSSFGVDPELVELAAAMSPREGN